MYIKQPKGKHESHKEKLSRQQDQTGVYLQAWEKKASTRHARTSKCVAYLESYRELMADHCEL